MDFLNSLLARETRTADDLKRLVDPELDLERMAKASAELTLRRFGRTITLYAPLYLSNFCINPCVYCGFSSRRAIDRATLSLEEIEREAQSLRARGFSHVLLVTGEDRRAADRKSVV